MAGSDLIKQEIEIISSRLFGNQKKQKIAFETRLLNMYTMAENKQFLLIHNPGGWGNTPVENLLQWERSIIVGVDDTIRKMGYKGALVQYFRSRNGFRAVVKDIREQMKFFAFKSKVMAEELQFITGHLKEIKIVMIGVSQGAAFSNAVLQRLDGEDRIFSIELGTPFYYKSKLAVIDKTLTLHNNGLMPDSLMEWNVPVILRTYFGAPFRWLKYKLQGKKVKFTYCINVPGHDYNWDYPEVQGQIEQFLQKQFGQNSDVEVAVK